MRLGPLLFLFPCILLSQTAPIQMFGSQGGILRPAGDSTLSNIILGSGISPEGKLHYSKDVFLVQPAVGATRQLTSFENAPGSLGATAVAVAPDASAAAYISYTNASGKPTEEVHVIALPSGTDRLIATDLEGCLQPLCPNCLLPCLHDLHFSADGRKVIWLSSQTNPIFVGNTDGSGVLRLQIPAAQLANSPNVVTTDDRLFFLQGSAALSVKLDGSGLTQLAYGPLSSDLVVSADGQTAAWQYATSVFGQNYYSIQLAGTGSATLGQAGTPYASLALSANGSKAEFVHDRQAVSYGSVTSSQITNFQYSDVLDIALNAPGTKVLYSTAEINNTVRAAIWIAGTDGSNPTPIFAPASINAGGVIGINSQGLPLPLSPGSYFTIYGENLHTRDELLVSNITLKVIANGVSLPLQALTPWQVNAFLPMNSPVGPLNLTLMLENGGQLTYTATVAQTAAALITFPNSSGQQQAAAFHLSTLLPCDAQHPAHAGDVVETYGFGLGETDPLQLVGVPAPYNPLAKTLFAPAVMIGTQKAQVLFSGLVPGEIGVYQVDIVAPTMPAGDYPMKWVLGDQTYISLGSFSIR